MAGKLSTTNPGLQNLPPEKLLSLAASEVIIHVPDVDVNNLYSARVVKATNNRLRINLPRGIIDGGYLRRTASVMINFVLDGTLYEAEAEYLADNDKVRELVLCSDIRPANRRHYRRISADVQVEYVPISDVSIKSGLLDKLRWIACTPYDVSGGGILIQTNLPIPTGAYFILGLKIESFSRKLFVFGQSRWSGQKYSGYSYNQCGLMFIPREELGNHFSRQALAEISPNWLQFDKKKQIELAAFIRKVAEHKQGRL